LRFIDLNLALIMDAKPATIVETSSKKDKSLFIHGTSLSG